MSNNVNTTKTTKTANQVTTKTKILKALAKGNLTVAQARRRFNVQNVSARISELRKQGHNIVCNRKVSKKGEVTYYYSLVS